MTGPEDAVLTPDTATDQSDSRTDAENADLNKSVGDLTGLILGSVDLPELLSQVATFAVRAIPGADGAGVTLFKTDPPDTDPPDNMVQVSAASHPFVAEIEEIQYAILGEGLSITAVLERRTVRSGSLGGEQLWPRFGPRVGRLGIHSALSLPLLVSDRVVGAINVYARAKDAFDDRAAEVGELFATPAAVAVHNAQVLVQTQALAAQLQSALSSRPIIDQAIGILRSRTGGSSEEAFGTLRQISQTDHVKLIDVAQQIVNGAVHRAREQHSNF